MPPSLDAAFSQFQARLVATLADPDVSARLLEGRWKGEWDSTNPTLGHCAVAAEAAWFALGGAAVGLVPVCASYHDAGGRATHWWLRTADGRIFDPTRQQYELAGETPPYEWASTPGLRIAACGFQGQRRLPSGAEDPWGFGKRPGRRAAQLLAAMGIHRRLATP